MEYSKQGFKMRVIQPNKTETFDFTLTVNGMGVVGASVWIMIKKGALGWDGGNWTSSIPLAMTPVDATNCPGLYQYAGLPYTQMAAGDRYGIRVYCEAYSVDMSELVGVEKAQATIATGDDADAASIKTTIGTAGAGLTALGDTRLANLDATVSSRLTPGGTLATVTAVTNRVTANTDQWAGTTIPAPVTAGVPKVDLTYILGSILSQTNNIAATFKKWFDVATPTGTVNSIPGASAGAAGGLAIVGSNMGTVSSVTGAVASVSGNVGGLSAQAQTDVKSAMTSQGYTTTRAGYLDVLNTLAATVWNALTAGMTTPNSIGKKFADWVIGTSQTGDAYAILSNGTYGNSAINANVVATKALLPTALVGGKMDAHVNDIAANAISDTSVSAAAVTKIQNGMATHLDITALNNLNSSDVVAAVATALSAYDGGNGVAKEATSLAIQTIVNTLKKYHKNKKHFYRDESNNTYLIIYDDDNITPIINQLLLTFDGTPVASLAGSVSPSTRQRSSV